MDGCREEEHVREECSETDARAVLIDTGSRRNATKKPVEQRSGHIRAESTVGEGTSFHFTLAGAGGMAAEHKELQCG